MNATTEALHMARDALRKLYDYADALECRHEDTYRVGAIWTICRDCSRKWADDRHPFKKRKEPAEFAAAEAAIAAIDALAQQASVPSAEPVYWQWRRKGDPWSLEKTFNSQVYATTNDSDVRPLYASATPLPAPAVQPPAPPGTTQEQPLKLTNLPAIGQPLDAGLFAGLTTKPDGTHCAVVLLADKPVEGVTWKQAMAWAKKLDAELPARPVSALLFANLKAQFDPAWYWTCESYDSSCAWCQHFGYGYQLDDDKSYAGRARAVRLIQLTA